MEENQIITPTSISGLWMVERPTFKDERGFFHEVFRLTELEKVTRVSFNPVQWSHSYSVPGVIRAIHTEGWNKLVYPVTGKAFIAIVDTRTDSPSFGKVETFNFDNTSGVSNPKALFITKGLGNSICVAGEEPVHYMYLVDEYWDDVKAQGIAWNDPDLAIKWPVDNPVISVRDQNNPTLRSLFPDKFKK